MATIKDIAKDLGVSISTVSYALNDNAKVSKETKERVREAAKRLNYQKNGFATDLKRHKTNTIALLVTDLASPYYSELVKGIQEVTWTKNFDLVACSSLGEQNSTAVKFLTEKRVDGAIILAHNIEEDIIAQSARKQFPVVLLDRILEHESVISIEVDNEKGSYQATEHFIKNGHREIAYISGVSDVRLHKLRFQGFMKALEEHGVEYHSKYTISTNFTQEGGYIATKMLIAQGDMPTAILYANDEMAIGGLKAFKEAGIRVPEEVSIIGFDDIELAQYVKPALTTVRQPKYERGALAAHLIFQFLEDASVEPYYKMPTELIVRDSCMARK